MNWRKRDRIRRNVDFRVHSEKENIWALMQAEIRR